MLYSLETVTAVMDLVRTYEPDIGEYRGHVDPGYNSGINLVMFTNGKLQIPTEVLNDFQNNPERITPERMRTLAKAFK